MLYLIGIAIDLAVAYLVLRDAQNFDWSGRWIKPMGWALLTVLLTPLFALIYLARRPRTARRPSAPGWYRDPERFDKYRYWDGQRWTPHTSPTRRA